jgi:hypothetical protein
MRNSFWRKLWTMDPISPRENNRPKRRHFAFQPKLESLEDRTLPAPLVFGILPPALDGNASAGCAPLPLQPVVIAAPCATNGSEPTRGQPANVAANQLRVTILENSPASVIDLGPLFAQISSVHPAEGLQLSLLGNTNPGLVKTDLSEGELTLTFAASQCGTASITVGATDADGASMRENILVIVLPISTLKPGGHRQSP